MTVLFEDIVVWTKYRLMWNSSFCASTGIDLTGRAVFTKTCDEILSMICAHRRMSSHATCHILASIKIIGLIDYGK
jgi:hypothetical protein